MREVGGVITERTLHVDERGFHTHAVSCVESGVDGMRIPEQSSSVSSVAGVLKVGSSTHVARVWEGLGG